jgi:hypoxanthine phosphoribosyltransferase
VTIQDSHPWLSTSDCLFSRDQVIASILELADQINQTIPTDQELLVLCLLNGGLIFTGQLLPHLNHKMQLGYVHATRYQKNQPGAQLQWLNQHTPQVAEKHILLCDDIFDEGKTLLAVRDHLMELGAATVQCAVMANKVHPRKPDNFVPNFCALQLPDRYVFGMGMDYSGYWRNAPGIFAVRENH